MGEKHVEKGNEIVLTVERFREIQDMNTEQLTTIPTHEKVIWLRWMIDKNTPSVVEGSNILKVDRENLISDAMMKFNQMSYPRRVSFYFFIYSGAPSQFHQ